MLFDYFAKLPSPLNVWIAHCLNSFSANSKLYSREIFPNTSKASHKICNRDGCMLNNAKALAVDLEVAQSGLCNNLGGNLLCSLIDLTPIRIPISKLAQVHGIPKGELMLKAHRLM
jgi:hypothetical protein